MTEAQQREYKKRLQQHCLKIIEARIASIHNLMSEAQSAANSEDKSSAGDKYETARAMSHLQKEMHASQLSSNMKEMKTLLSVDHNKVYESATAGSLVNCGAYSFFISAGLGKVIFEDIIVFLVSPFAPISKILNGKKTGDQFVFNNKVSIIEDVC